MKIIKSLALGGLLALASTTSFAQDHGPKGNPSEHAARMTEKMRTELKLDDAKTAEIQAINQRFANAASEIHKNNEITEEQKKAQMKAAKEQHHTELSGVLSAEQMQKLKEMKAENKTSKEEGRKATPEQRAAKITSKMNEVLALSEEQFQKVSALNLGVEQKIDAIRNDANMSEEKKKEFIKGNRQSQRDALSNILTPEQLEKWNAYKHGEADEE